MSEFCFSVLKLRCKKQTFFSLILLIFTCLTLKEKNPCVLGIAEVLMGKVPKEKYLIRRTKIGSAFLRGCSSFLGAVALRHRQGLSDSLATVLLLRLRQHLSLTPLLLQPSISPVLCGTFRGSNSILPWQPQSLLLELCFWLCSQFSCVPDTKLPLTLIRKIYLVFCAWFPVLITCWESQPGPDSPCQFFPPAGHYFLLNDLLLLVTLNQNLNIWPDSGIAVDSPTASHSVRSCWQPVPSWTSFLKKSGVCYFLKEIRCLLSFWIPWIADQSGLPLTPQRWSFSSLPVLGSKSCLIMVSMVLDQLNLTCLIWVRS